MPIAFWNQRYETGNDVIDEQHQLLFDAVNAVHDAIHEGKGQEQIKQCLEFFVDNTIEHFQCEERFMQKMKYPKYAAHVARHSELVGKACRLLVHVDTGQHVTVAVTEFIAEWLRHHINEDDAEYAHFARTKRQIA